MDRPGLQRRHWKRARTGPATGSGPRSATTATPQSYDANFVPDAAALMVPVLGLASRRDPVDGASLGNVLPRVVARDWPARSTCSTPPAFANAIEEPGLTLWRVARFASLRW